ncbi:MAG: hypothetical protein QXH24_02750 [Candidatus Bathyarchaeia archaeon]
MRKWYCFKCKEEMQEVNLTIEYLGISGSVEGLRCPKCGAAYLTEEVVKEKVLRAQELIESKVGR